MNATADRWTDLGDGLLVRQSKLFHMNSVLLLASEHALLVDPGVLPSDLDALKSRIAAGSPAAVTLFLTHSHWDHVLGRPWWPNAQTIAHDRFAAHVAANAAEIRAEAERYASEAHERWPAPFQPFRPDVAASGLHYTTIGPWRVVFRDAPGHDDAQLSLHLPERRVLIAADMLSDVEVPMLDRPPSAYVRTLEALLPIADGGAIETLIPGHGSIAEGRDAVLERFRRDLDYLRRLVREVAALRSRGVTRERALEQSAPWEDVERHPDYAMREVHRENLGHAWDERRAKR